MRPLSFEDDLSQLIARTEPSMLFGGSTPDELERWQGAFRETLVGLLGRMPARADLRIELHESAECDGYTRTRVTYQTEADVFVPAYLLWPAAMEAGQRRPGLLCVHGHGHFGKDSVAGITDTPERLEEVSQLAYNYGERYARAGFVALCPDLRGFGERRPGYPGPRVDYCMRNYMCATLLGTTIVALHIVDLSAALDVLQSLDGVDAGRLGVVGLSLGGRMSMMLAALDERVSVCVASGCMNLFQERYQALTQCGAQLVPGLLQFGDTPEIFSLIAPRTLVLEIGLQDPLIPPDWAKRGLERVSRAWAAAGACERLFVDEFAGGHEFSGRVADDVLNRWRGGTL